MLGATGSSLLCASECAIGALKGRQLQRAARLFGRERHDGIVVLSALRCRMDRDRQQGTTGDEHYADR